LTNYIDKLGTLAPRDGTLALRSGGRTHDQGVAKL
jgi:hypothetical protein